MRINCTVIDNLQTLIFHLNNLRRFLTCFGVDWLSAGTAVTYKSTPQTSPTACTTLMYCARILSHLHCTCFTIMSQYICSLIALNTYHKGLPVKAQGSGKTWHDGRLFINSCTKHVTHAQQDAYSHAHTPRTYIRKRKRTHSSKYFNEGP